MIISRSFGVLCFALLIAGCASSGEGSDPGFAKSFKAVNTGASKEQVRAALGAPNWKHSGRVGTAQAVTPNAELGQVLPNGTPFEVWRYDRGQDWYYIYFASGSGAAVEDWRVVSREAVPKSR